MERNLEKQNLTLRNTIKELELSIKALMAKQLQPPPISHDNVPNKQPQTIQDTTSHSLVEYSPIHTYESLQEQTASLSTQQRSFTSQMPAIKPCGNLQNSQLPAKHIDEVKFQLQDQLESTSNLANSQMSKQLELSELKYKKSTAHYNQVQPHNKAVYNSAMKEKEICEECLIRMHQLHEMQFLKNKYHREYIALRSEVQKLKSQQLENETPRSSINLIEFYPDHTEEKSQKSSFSFENIQNTLLSQRFALEIQQCLKLIDKLLPLDRKSIELSTGDFKLLFELQLKIEKLKSHLGLETEPKCLDELFNELQKSELLVKKIHDKYKKLIQKMSKTHKDKLNKAKHQFNDISNKFVTILNQFNDQKRKHSQLTSQISQLKTQITQLKAQIAHHQLKQPKPLSLSSSHQIKPSSNKQTKDPSLNQTLSNKEKDLHETSSSHCEKTSALSDTKLEKELQKMQSKLKNNQKYTKTLQKMLKQQKAQLLSIKKKYLNDFNQFMNSILFSKQSKLRNTSQQTDIVEEEIQKLQQPQSIISQPQLISQTQSIRQSQSISQSQPISEKQLILQPSTKSLPQKLAPLVYQIFSYTSWQNEDLSNMFLPQNQTQILQMLKNIKKFAQRFDQWQKQKQKQINSFQKNFLHLLKFFIDNYKVSELKLLEQIAKMKDNQPLALYIKRYYSKAAELSDSEERDSSSFTFGPKSQSCQDCEEP